MLVFALTATVLEGEACGTLEQSHENSYLWGKKYMYVNVDYEVARRDNYAQWIVYGAREEILVAWIIGNNDKVPYH